MSDDFKFRRVSTFPSHLGTSSVSIEDATAVLEWISKAPSFVKITALISEDEALNLASVLHRCGMAAECVRNTYLTSLAAPHHGIIRRVIGWLIYKLW